MSLPPLHWRIRMWLLNRLNSYRYFDNWLNSLVPDSNFTFIQIGANDGLRNDPVHQFVKKLKWKSLLVEPQKRAFESLKENYKDYPNIMFENVAIGEDDGTLELFSIDDSEAKEWHDLIATAKPSVGILKDQEAKIVSTKVPALKLESLLLKHHISSVDLMLFDLEGYEPTIFKNYNWSVKPKKVYFETRHLSYMEFLSVQHILMKNGYKLFTESGDCLAWLD